MRCSNFRVLATHVLLFLAADVTLAEDTTTTTQRSTTVLTLTTTVTSGQSVFPSTSTETTVIAGDASMATGTAPAGPVSTGALSYSSDALQAAVLNSTNYYRAQHQANALTWDDDLAKYAQDYAKKCEWEHSGGQYGENLASGYASPVYAIDAWAGEEKKYNYNKAKFSESTGHFTQLVWKNTTGVGCGAAECSSSGSNGVNGWMLVCEYSPQGNVVGEFKDSVGKPGESSSDRLGFGGASATSSGTRLLGALAAAYFLLAICM